MNKTRTIVAAAALVLLTTGFFLVRHGKENGAARYRFATVQRGNVEATVSATGTLTAVRTVQVGTQVSGQVSAIYTDYNERVRKGQLLARIDPTLAQQSVRDAEAGLERNTAELHQAERDYAQAHDLHASQVITDTEFNDAQYKLAVARADVKSARVALERARRNLAYTAIYAPIDGIVVERDVDVGQTVAASLQAPQLFVLANDLGRLQILANVDESDIGEIRQGLAAQFSVQAYPNETFTGSVEQVRLQSTSKDNVVTYTVVVAVDNPRDKLLPGMTATVDFVTGQATDVFTVPNGALRLRPTDAMRAALRASGAFGDSSQWVARRRSGSAGGGFGAGIGAGASGRARQSGGRSNRGRLFYLSPDGKLAVARVQTGITDGQRTQVQGSGLKDGMQIIVGLVQPDDDSKSAAAGGSPFQSGGQQSGGGGSRRAPGGF